MIAGNDTDTIFAISSAAPQESAAWRTIIRLSGADVFEIIGDVFSIRQPGGRRRIIKSSIRLDCGPECDAFVYCFPGPGSYTGQDMAEIHIAASVPAVRSVLRIFSDRGARPAEPGQFTLRAYLNGRIDLSQAEAVAQIVAGSNMLQVAAAERLLSGRLTETAVLLRKELLEIISLLEAGLDFSTEDIEFITKEKACEKIFAVRDGLESLLCGSIHCRELVEMPSVGLAGAANAGKSSLLNALLKKPRSIVSAERNTTRDILSGELELAYGNCAIFDCAGIDIAADESDIAGELARQASAEALKKAELVLFCVDITRPGRMQELELLRLSDFSRFIVAATKCDIPGADELNAKISELNETFGVECTATSSLTGLGLESLGHRIEKALAGARGATAEAGDRIAITERHRRLVQEAIDNLLQAAELVGAGREEIASMMLRTAYEALGGVEREYIDEAVLGRIFSAFCVGK